MSTGRGNYLTKQTGEYLVAAELSRKGYIATTFTGNVPEYDIVAVDEAGGHALVQVKAITTDKLQVNAGYFADIVFDGHRQIVRGVRRSPYPALFFVLVRLASADPPHRDRFFILPWQELASVVTAHHAQYLAKHDGVRPRQWKSLHAAFDLSKVEASEGAWDVLRDRLTPIAGAELSRP